MLSQLSVSNIALIEDAQISFGPGLTVLSGETGAGKTALLSALKLLIGERADSAMLRDGAAQATVDGVFLDGSTTLSVRRRFDAGGRSRCWIDGAPVSVAQLAQRVGPLVDLHGQHEHQALLDPASHLTYFDVWVGAEATQARGAYRAAWVEHAQAQREWSQLDAARRSSRQEQESARFVIQDIENVAPREGEYEELQESLPALQHAQDLATAANEAYVALYDEGGAVDRLGSARTLMERSEALDPHLSALVSQLDDLLGGATDVASNLRAYRDGLEFDPRVIEQRMDRLGELDGLCHRYGPRMVDVLERLEHAHATVDLADTSDERFEQARAALDEAEQTLVSAAAQVADVRFRNADAFSAALSEAVASLGMAGASLVASVTDLPRGAWTADGSQHVEFLYAPGAAVAPRPLARIASGGELSRVMLALKGSMTAHGSDVTLVFDEVDAGIGGATANLVAERLCQLAQDNQVIVVTHLPQIAAVADAQMHVSKDDAALPRTTIVSVEGDLRVREIARMLSGQEDEVSLAHARELLRKRVS